MWLLCKVVWQWKHTFLVFLANVWLFLFRRGFCMQPFIHPMKQEGSHICIDMVFNSERKHVKHNYSLLVRWPCLSKSGSSVVWCICQVLGSNVLDTRVWGIKKKKQHRSTIIVMNCSLQFASQDIIPSNNTCRAPVVCFWSSVISLDIKVSYKTRRLCRFCYFLKAVWFSEHKKRMSR